jgi:hypothetical protein
MASRILRNLLTTNLLVYLFKFVVLLSVLGTCDLLSLCTASAQPSSSQGIAKRITPTICGFDVISGFGVSPIPNNSEARHILDEVLLAAGVRSSSITLRPAKVGNARACEDDGKRYILYDPSWVNELIESTGSDWTARFILAHEAGHHFKAHSILLEGERGCSAALEAEADEVAGSALAKLGATLEQAQAPLKKIADEKGDDCYPSREERLAAVLRGWNKVKIPRNPNEITKFTFLYNFGDHPGDHIWTRVTETVWTETHPTGDSDYVDLIGPTSVEGDPGILLRHRTKPEYEYFIPNKGGRLMYLRIRLNRGDWSFLGEMKNIQ